MNTEQIGSHVRLGLNLIAGILTAHGVKESSIVNSPDAIALGIVIATALWGHFNHRDDKINPPTYKTTLLALMLPLLFCNACAHLDPGARAVVVRAEQSITVANSTFNAAVHIDDANRSFFRTNAPAFHRFCEFLRAPVVIAPLTNSFPRGLAIVRSADAVKNRYKTTGSTNDFDALTASLAAVESLTSEAQKQITAVNLKK